MMLNLVNEWVIIVFDELMIIVLELVKEWMIIVLEFGKEVDDHFNA